MFNTSPRWIFPWKRRRLALDYGIDLVLELPTLYNTNSADHFAYYSVKILNAIGIDTLIFGSESNNPLTLIELAKQQQEKEFNRGVKEQLKKGLNYKVSLNKSLKKSLKSNYTLGIDYIKAIKKINPKIKIETIKRKNDYNDIDSNTEILSASNLRKKIKENKDISKHIPPYNQSLINKIDEKKLFELLKYKIITDNHLNLYLGVDEGLENKIKKEIYNSSDLNSLLNNIKSKRYTYLRLKRMLIHILLGIEKKDLVEINNYRVLGFNQKGKTILKISNPNLDFKTSPLEKRSSIIYYELTHDPSTKFETLNKPIIKDWLHHYLLVLFWQVHPYWHSKLKPIYTM